MTTNLLDALYLNWFESGPLKDSFFEVRHVPYPNPKQVAFPRFYRAPYCPAQWKGRHLFFGVNPRSTVGNSQSVSHVVALYADIDRNDSQTMLQIRDFHPRISGLVSSGRGLHAYWFLDRPIPVSQSGDVPAILRGISGRLNADPAAVSPAQLLRLPGSFNPKNNAECSELFVDHRIRYDLQEFSAFRMSTNLRCTQPRDGSDRLKINTGGSLPERFIRDLRRNKSLRRIWTGEHLPEYRSGSERDFALSMKLAWRDYSLNEIATILLRAPYPKRCSRTLNYLIRTTWQASTIVAEAKLNRVQSILDAA